MPGTLHIPDTQGVDCNDCICCAGCVVWDGLGHGTETIQEACAFLLFFLVAIFKVPHVINPGHLGKDMAHNRADSSGLEHKTALNM